MIKHEIKTCPRCKNSFTCKVGDIINCQCTEVCLTEKTQQFLDKTNYDCLCKSCMIHFNELTEIASQNSFPTQKEMMKQGVHFYIENGNWVFTELYHALRGNCCKSGCRHCVYGFTK